jgi:CRISPR type III-A-associated RAMP protein Csm5
MALPDDYKNTVISYPLTITTLMPVCVKSHEEPMSPLADYVCEDDKIHIINQQKFMNLLTSKDGLLESYANMVNQVNVQSPNKHEEFKKFMSDNRISVAAISDYSRPYSIQGSLTQISRHIHSAGRAYIPGSTLKGVVRNALFEEFCHKNRVNTKPINDFLKARKNHNQISFNKKNGIKNTEAFFNAKEKGYLYNNASLWGFEDSAFVDSEDISIIQLNRKRLVYKEEEKNLESLSVLQEVILPAVTLQTKLFFRNRALDVITKGKIENSYNQQHISPHSVFEALNQSSKSFIAFQKEHVQHNDTNLYKKQLNELEQLVAEFLKNNQMALCCIGFGKSILQNTIALSIQDNWERLRIDSPTTFFTEAQTGQTIGWCVIGTDGYIPEKITTNYEFTEISGCRLGDEALVRVKSIRTVKPKVLIAETRFNREQTEIDVVGLDHTNYQEGDWLKVELKDKSKLGEFKQAKFKEQLF